MSVDEVEIIVFVMKRWMDQDEVVFHYSTRSFF